MIAALRRAGGPLVVMAAVIAFAIWHVRQLEKPTANVSDLALLAVLGVAAPFVASLATGRLRLGLLVAGGLGTLVAAVGIATGHWPYRPHPLGSTGYFSLAASQLWEGASRWINVLLPFEVDRYPELHAAMIVVWVSWVFALAVLFVTLRLTAPTIVVAFLPFLVLSTVYQLPRVTLRGATMLVLALAVLAVLGQRRRRRLTQGVVALGLALAAALIAATPGIARGNFVEWRKIGKPDIIGVSVSYVWDHTYGPLDRPKKATRLLRIRTPREIESYWRTTTLDCFNGIGWWECESPGGRLERGARYRPAGEQLPRNLRTAQEGRFTADIENVGLDDSRLPKALDTVEVERIPASLGVTEVLANGTIRGQRALRVGDRWKLQAVEQTPTPKQLTDIAFDLPPDIGEAAIKAKPEMLAVPYDVENRGRLVRREINLKFGSPAQTEAMLRVYTLAEKIVRDQEAATPYEAVVAIENWFQENFTYSEKADYRFAPEGPLPAFILGDGRAGYCQMFSGSMTLMLRLLGIPARVAEGFTAGTWNSGSKIATISDKDAHAWVEVYFTGYGWVPFEPTPGRALGGSASTTADLFADAVRSDFPSGAAVTLGGAALAKLLEGRRFGGASAFREAGAEGSDITIDQPWKPGFFTYVGGVAAIAFLLLQIAKRREAIRARLTSDPAQIAAATRADLLGYVRDQGVVGPTTALTADELRDLLRREFQVDAGAWARAQTRARYGRPGSGRRSAAIDARRAARDVRRGLRRSLGVRERARGAISLRSLQR